MEITEDFDGDFSLIDYSKNIIDRLTLAIDTKSAIGNLASWLCDYTKLDEDTYFSFKDHEMQIDIINDTCARQVVQKCSQVGLSEGELRKALGITAISKAIHVIYAMPSRTLVSKFSTSRILPVVDTSPMLASMRNKNAKGAELIGLGTSFLHLGGTTGAATGAISVPAKYIFIDELDFCDLEVVGKYESRLKHAPEDAYGRKGTICYFSTPTLEDYGINAKFKATDQKHYQVHCSGCDDWFEPDYFRDICIPGYDKNLIELTGEDIDSGTLDIQHAYMRCPYCTHDVWDDLCNPKRRKWVARFPESITSGRQVYPWDVPNVNSIPSILMQLSETTGYKSIADYYNFGIGIPFADKNNSFLLSPFENGPYSRWLDNKVIGDKSRFCMGVDVGRKAHIVIGKKDNVGKYHVHYVERFKASKEELLGERIVTLAKLFSTRSIVIDAMPDFTTAQYVAKKLPSRLVLACEYTKTKGKGKMSNFEADREKNLVHAYRTGVLTDYLNAHNGGDVLYPNAQSSKKASEEIAEYRLNLKNLKKVTKLDKEGEEVQIFIKTGADHYGHATSYFKIACDALKVRGVAEDVTAAPVRITSFATQGVKPSLPVAAIGASLGVPSIRRF